MFQPSINGLEVWWGSESYKYFAPTALMTRLLFILGILVACLLPVAGQPGTINVAAFDASKHFALPLIGDAKVTLEELFILLDGYAVDEGYRMRS